MSAYKVRCSAEYVMYIDVEAKSKTEAERIARRYCLSESVKNDTFWVDEAPYIHETYEPEEVM